MYMEDPQPNENPYGDFITALGRLETITKIRLPDALSRREKMRIFALLYTKREKIAAFNIEDTILFLVAAFTLESAMEICAKGFPEMNKKLEDYGVAKYVSLSYDKLLPGVTQPVFSSDDATRMLEAIKKQIESVTSPINPVPAPASPPEPVTSMKETPPEVVQKKGVAVIIASTRFLLDRADPTGTERAAVARLVKKFEEKQGAFVSRKNEETKNGIQ